MTGEAAMRGAGMRRLFSEPRNRLLAILALALIIRSLGLVSRPIWYDEAFSILFSQTGPSAMLRGTLASPGAQAAEEHPLAYYLMLWSWMRAFGSSLAAARLLSILAGVLSVDLLYLIARQLFSERLGWLAALFGALAPFQVHYSQEIRMYAFLGLWLLLSTYAFLRSRQTQNWRWWAVFSVSAALAQYTHALAGLYLLPLALTPLFERDWRTLKGNILAGLAALFLYLPWLVQLPAQFAKVSTSYWLERPDVSRLMILPFTYMTNLWRPRDWILLMLSIVTFLLFIAFWQMFKAIRSGASGSRAGLWLLYLSFAPPLLSFIISQWKPIYLDRTFVASGAVFCIWLAWAFFATRLPRPIQLLAALGLAACALIGIQEHLTYKGIPYAPFRELQAELKAGLEPGDKVIHANKLSYLPALYFDRSLPQAFVVDVPGSKDDTLASVTQQVLGLVSSPDIESAARGSQRIWYIVYQRPTDIFGADGAASRPDLEWLRAHLRQDSVEELGSLLIYRFSR